ncbi:hypothetical protein OAI26_03175 [Sulfitobacter sp.]|nr:hypothetical protein [Sulfitobacter sp.]
MRIAHDPFDQADEPVIIGELRCEVEGVLALATCAAQLHNEFARHGEGGFLTAIRADDRKGQINACGDSCGSEYALMVN